MDIKTLKKALPVCFKSNVTMLISGPHGIGKSDGVKQAIDGQNLGKTFDYRLGQMADVGDIIGLLDASKSDDHCEFKMPKRFYEIVQYCLDNPDKYGVIFFDELNRTTKDILQAIFQIVLDHELNGFKFPENMKAVCAINPATDDYNVLDFDDKAFADRFCHVKFEPSVADWLEYARQTDVDASITAFIGEHNEALEKPHKDFDLPAEPSRRSWVTVNRIKQNCEDNSIFQELLIGMVGLEPATMYLDFCRTFNEKIKGIEVLNNYKKVKKQVLKHSALETDRTDLLRDVCDQIKVELEKIDKMSKKWETNLVEFLCDIPKDVAMGTVSNFFDIPSFLNTESDEEHGLAGGNFEASSKLIKQFEGWKSTKKKTESVEDKKEVESEDIPF